MPPPGSRALLGGVDPKTDQVVVQADSSVTGPKLTKVEAAVAKLGARARLTLTQGTVKTEMSGGDMIVSDDGGFCTAGFNVRVGSVKYVVTAGHCTRSNAFFRTEKTHQLFARVVDTGWWRGQDWGLADYLNPAQPADPPVTNPGNVDLHNGGSHQDITQAGTPVVGQLVTGSGAASGLHTGIVTRLNQTVNYGGGSPDDPVHSISGLIFTTNFTEGGDSGGPLFSGTTGYGVNSGGDGTESYYAPITEALSAWHAQLY